MSELLHTDWRWYGGSDIPWWLMLPVAAATLYLMLRWLRAERRRISSAARLLPVTATLLVAAVTALVVQPVWVRIDTWSSPADRVVILDESASMEMPVAGQSQTSQLDALAFFSPEAAAGRTTLPRDLAAKLQAQAAQAGDLERELRRVLAEREQQLPSDADARAAWDRASRWLQALRTGPLVEIETLRQALLLGAGFPAAAADAASVLLTALADTLSAPPPEAVTADGAAPATEAVNAMAHRVTATASTLQGAPAALHALQQASDKAFVDAGGTTLADALATAAAHTRRDVAQRLLACIQPPPRVVSTAPQATERDATDLFGALAHVLDTREGRAISDIILLSDGGQNAPPLADVPQRLRHAGIRLTIVGTGLPEAEPDLAIIDWQAPALALRNEETVLRVRLKLRPGDTSPVQLELRSGETVLAAPEVTPDGSGAQGVTIPFRLTEEGRSRLQLTLTTPNANPQNDRIDLSVDVRRRAPRALLVGSEPNWDTTYWVQAGRTAGLAVRQCYTGLSDEPPSRGSGRQDVPQTAEQWSRYETIVLHGAPFAGFGAEDAQALLEAVARSGCTLLLLTSADTPSYVEKLGAAFGWNAGDAPTLPAQRLVLTPSARHLPMMRIGTDGSASGRQITAFTPAATLRRVPEQQVPLLCAEGDSDAAVLSLGFYGRGKVLLCGITGLHQMAEYRQAALLARLLAQLMADTATPVALAADTAVAVYPGLPVRGHAAILVALNPDGGMPLAEGTGALTELPGMQNRLSRWVPSVSGEAWISDGTARAPVTVIDNPGMEQMFYTYDEAFLETLAQAAGGRRLPLPEAAAALGELPLERWQGTTARRYAPADHWLLAAAAALLGTLHWVLRKVSGLAM